MKISLGDIISFLAYIVLFVLAIFYGQQNIYAYCSLGLSLLCALIWVIARKQLGDAFTVTAQANKVISTGIYSKIRHPIYIFGTMAFLFIVFAFQGLAAIIIWAIVIFIQVIRINKEEKVLSATFGQEYIDYRKRTWF